MHPSLANMVPGRIRRSNGITGSRLRSAAFGFGFPTKVSVVAETVVVASDVWGSQTLGRKGNITGHFNCQSCTQHTVLISPPFYAMLYLAYFV